MSGKEEAIIEIVDLANRFGISQNEISNALKKPDENVKKSNSLMRLFTWLGGIFIFSGVSAYIFMFWGDMNSAMRIIITLGSGLTCYFLALAALNDERYKNSANVLFLIAAILETGGLFVTLYEIFGRSDDWHPASILVFSVMLIQQAATFISKKHVFMLLYTTIFFAAALFATILDYIEIDNDLTATITGFSLLCVCYGLIKTPYHYVMGFWYFIGSAIFFCGVFQLLEDSIIEVLFVGISCFIMYLSTVVRSNSLLFMGVIALLFYIAYFTEEHFLDSVGWPIALIVLGFVFIGISSFALKIKQKYI